MLEVEPRPDRPSGAAGGPRSRTWENTRPCASDTRSSSFAAVLLGTNTTASACFSSPGLIVPQVAVLSVTWARPFQERSFADTDCATPVPTFLSFSRY